MKSWLLIVCVFFLPAAWAGPTRAIQKAGESGNRDRLLSALNHDSGFVREQAARALARLPSDSNSIAALLSCLQAESERGYVRAACAQSLASYQARETDGAMISAMAQVDPESRYWIADALARLRTQNGQAHLAGLTSDPDLYLSTSAREWVR
jgi:HEAT repeat protein